MNGFVHDIFFNWEFADGNTNYQRCYTAIVQEDNKVLSTAVVKISERDQVAELPFVGTLEDY